MSRIFCVLLILAMVSPLLAEPTTQPSVKPATTPDYCNGLVQPYNPVAEQGRFLNAAGQDGQLTAQEFASNAGKPLGFVRRFDTWEALKTCDKNANGTIDWFEANAYRQAFAKKVLAAFDADKDTQLSPAEQAQANAALHAGRVRLDAADTTAGGAPSRRPGRGDRRNRWREFDTDGDGKLSDAEREAMMKKIREQAQARREAYEKALLEKYDADGDGQLSDEEKQTARAKESEARRQRWLLRRFDKDGDGQLSAEETAAKDEAVKRWQKRREEWAQRREEMKKRILEKYDADGDGELNDAERKAFRDDRMKQAEKMRQTWRSIADMDGDGEVTRAERRTTFRKLARYGQSLSKTMDTDGDGSVSAEEGKAWWSSMKKAHDADGDGQLNEAEMDKLIEAHKEKIQQTPAEEDSSTGPGATVVPLDPDGTSDDNAGPVVVTSEDGQTGMIAVISRPDGQASEPEGSDGQ